MHPARSAPLWYIMLIQILGQIVGPIHVIPWEWCGYIWKRTGVVTAITEGRCDRDVDRSRRNSVTHGSGWNRYSRFLYIVLNPSKSRSLSSFSSVGSFCRTYDFWHSLRFVVCGVCAHRWIPTPHIDHTVSKDSPSLRLYIYNSDPLYRIETKRTATQRSIKER